MGGFVGDILGGIGDAVSGVVGGIVDGIESVGRGIDDMVHDIIPGGWAGVAAGALMAVGIYDPELLGMANAGTLTSEALTNAGLDAATVATDVAAVTPEAAAAAETAAATGAVAPEAAAAAADAAGGLGTEFGTNAAYDAALGETAGGSIAPSAIEGASAAGQGQAITDAAGNTLVSAGSPGMAPVYDAATTAGTSATANAADPTLWQGMKDLGSAGLASLGLGGMSATQIAGMAAAGLLAPSVLSALGMGGGAKAIGSSNTNGSYVPTVAPIAQPALAQPGLNPGYIHAQPYYATTNDVQSKYTWNQHPYMQTAADLSHFNEVPGATAQPWGVQAGPEPFDVNTFIKNTINPGWTAAAAGSAPGTYRPPAYASATPGVVTATPTAPVAPQDITAVQP